MKYSIIYNVTSIKVVLQFLEVYVGFFGNSGGGFFGGFYGEFYGGFYGRFKAIFVSKDLTENFAPELYGPGHYVFGRLHYTPPPFKKSTVSGQGPRFLTFDKKLADSRGPQNNFLFYGFNFKV